jgi:hypothetical protein
MWAVLDQAAAGSRGFTYTPADTRQLPTICRHLGITRPRPKHEPTSNEDPDAAVTPAA